MYRKLHNETGRRLIAADPLREDVHANLMRFFAAAGRPSEALRQYRDLERILRDELCRKIEVKLRDFHSP